MTLTDFEGEGHRTRVRWAAVTDPGRLRAENEDAHCVVEWPEGAAVASRHLLAVADGLGGHQAGEVASATAIAKLCDAFTSWDGAAADRFVEPALQKANL